MPNVILTPSPALLKPSVALVDMVARISTGKSITMVMPFKFNMAEDGEDWWTPPYEPLITVSGENVIVKRNVARSTGRGTVKERWTEGDIKIVISGSFVNYLNPFDYPDAEVGRLLTLVKRKKPIDIQNELLQLLNVNRIVIEKYSLPHSKGENVQNYTIDAVSDDDYKLYIEMKSNV